MEEKRFQTKLIKFLEAMGAFVTKYNANGLSKTGVPDILYCYKGHYVALEVKKEKGKRSDIQQWNINEIRKAGGQAFIIAPQDFTTEMRNYLIEEEYFMMGVALKYHEKEITKID